MSGNRTLVLLQDEWYRAVKCQSKYLLIDWGNMEVINEHDSGQFK